MKVKKIQYKITYMRFEKKGCPIIVLINHTLVRTHSLPTSHNPNPNLDLLELFKEIPNPIEFYNLINFLETRTASNLSYHRNISRSYDNSSLKNINREISSSVPFHHWLKNIELIWSTVNEHALILIMLLFTEFSKIFIKKSMQTNRQSWFAKI